MGRRVGFRARGSTVEARKLEHSRPPTPNQRKMENPHKSPYIHVPTLRSLLYGWGLRFWVLGVQDIFWVCRGLCKNISGGLNIHDHVRSRRAGTGSVYVTESVVGNSSIGSHVGSLLLNRLNIQSYIMISTVLRYT